MKTKESKFKRKIKQKIYSYHKYLAFFTIIPVIFWSISGMMHPFMSHFFKPEITRNYLEKQTIDTAKIKFTLKEVLDQNNLKEIKNFRIVNFNQQFYYQVKNKTNDLLYFNTSNASLLKNGDARYAEWLARYFLDDQNSKISNAEVLSDFDQQYKYINRYLPVHKITFDRADEMQIYVETASSKLATFNPKSRQIFITLFDLFHNFSFLEKFSNDHIRILFVSFSLFIILCSAISGLVIYGFFWKQFKKINATTSELKARKNHRKFGLIFSFFTFAFVFSGLFHIIKKWEPNTIPYLVYEPIFKTKNLNFDLKSLPVNWQNEINFGLIDFEGKTYVRSSVKTFKEAKKTGTNDWKDKAKPVFEIAYYDCTNLNIKKDLEVPYAQFLVEKLNEKHHFIDKHLVNKSNQSKVAILTDFDKREYGFVNKRLPVVKLAFKTPENHTFFLETATSRIAAKVTNYDRAEGYSFAIFHKFLYLEWAGKSIRDLIAVITALSILIMSILGLRILFKK